MFDYPLNLHISQTKRTPHLTESWFDYPLNLHISQTGRLSKRLRDRFDYPLNLHISQTAYHGAGHHRRLIIL